MTQPSNHPFKLTDSALVEAAYNEVKANKDKAEKLRDEADKTLTAIYRELGDTAGHEPDFSKITSVQGTDVEKLEYIIKVHSDLAGATYAINQLRSFARFKNWRESLDGETALSTPSAPLSPVGIGHNGGPSMMDEIRRNLNGNPLTAIGPGEGGGAGMAPGVEFPMAALFERSDGWTPEVLRSGHVQLAQQMAPRFYQLMGPPIPTTQTGIKYMVETITAAGVAEVAEGAASAEMDLSYAEAAGVVQTLRAHLPITNEQMADEPMIEGFLRGRMGYLAERRLDRQLLNGNGTAPNLLGVFAITGLQTQTVPKANGGKDPLSEIRRAMNLIARSGDIGEASGICIHPDVWTAAVLMRADAVAGSDRAGEFLYGHPALAPMNTAWGMPVVEHSAIEGIGASLNTASKNYGVVGDFIMGADIYLRQGAIVEMGLNTDDFVKYKQTLRVVLRAMAVWYRPQAFVRLRTSA